MKQRNTKSYGDVIERLKAFKAAKKTEAYRELMKEICSDYGISNKTVYRDMKRRVPGARKPRADQGVERRPVPKKLLDEIYELMKKGKTQKEAIEIAGHISTKKAAAMKPEETNESSFGGPVRDLVRKVYEADKISLPVKMELNGRKFELLPEEIDDLMMIIASAYNRAVTSGSNKMQVDRLQLAKSKLYYLLDEQIRIAQERYDLKAVELLSRIYERLRDKDFETNTNFKVFQLCMQQLKPDITIDECINLIKQFSE